MGALKQAMIAEADKLFRRTDDLTYDQCLAQAKDKIERELKKEDSDGEPKAHDRVRRD
jgi:hypothetical protein